MLYKINTYKLKDGTIVFDYPEFFVYKEPFIKGSDELINYNTYDSDCASITFSDRPIKNANAVLHYHHSESDGDYYVDQISNIDCYLCPALLKFFDKKPMWLFAKIKPIK